MRKTRWFGPLVERLGGVQWKSNVMPYACSVTAKRHGAKARCSQPGSGAGASVAMPRPSQARRPCLSLSRRLNPLGRAARVEARPWWSLWVLPRALAVVEMRQDAFDHGRIFDAGNDFHRPATGLAGLDIDLEHAV